METIKDLAYLEQALQGKGGDKRGRSIRTSNGKAGRT